MPAIRNASFGRHLSAAAAAPCVAYAVLFATSDSYQASPIGMDMKCEAYIGNFELERPK